MSAFRGVTVVRRSRGGTGAVANDPGCVKTLHGIIAPGILGSVVMRRAKKRKNLSSARYYDQIRFRFHTTKTHLRHWLCTATMVLMPVSAPIKVLV
jgi:hypothetical protein